MSTFDKNITTEELLQMLAKSRENESNFKKVTKSMIEEVKATQEYQESEALAKAETALIENLTAEIKARGVAEFNATGNKKPFGGVTIKVFKVLKVVKQEMMEEWVKIKLAAAVKTVFDMDIIIEYAKKNPIPGTEMVDDIRAEIASKLP